MKANRLSIFLLALLALLTSGCSIISIQNISQVDVRVSIKTPDSSRSYTKLIGSGAVAETFSNHGGVYTIATLPNEEYRQLVNGVRDQLSERLFNERQTLSAADVAEIVRRIEQLESALDDLVADQDSCSGTVADFESAVAVISWDFVAERWLLSCGSSAE